MAILSKSQMLTMFHMSEGVLKKYIDEGLPYQLQGRSKVFDEDAVTTHIREKQAALEAQLVIGKEYSNAEISNIFRGNEQRGMKKSNSFNALVLLSTHESDNLYDDYWDGNILYYTGMGFDGDQRLDFYENKTLAESNQNGVTVYLFEGFEHHDYFYRGIVRLKGTPFQKEEKDQSGSLRKVWKFPLELCSSNSYLGQEIITEEHEDKISAAKRLGTEALRKKAEDASRYNKSSIRNVVSKVHERNELVREYSLRRAAGVCELCHQPAPFEVNGIPYLESHHIVWLSRDGDDAISNTAAVCPNCHRRLHKLDLASDVAELKTTVAADEEKMVSDA